MLSRSVDQRLPTLRRELRERVKFDALVERRAGDLEGVVAEGFTSGQIPCDGPLAAARRIRCRCYEVVRLVESCQIGNFRLFPTAGFAWRAAVLRLRVKLNVKVAPPGSQFRPHRVAEIPTNEVLVDRHKLGLVRTLQLGLDDNNGNAEYRKAEATVE